MTCFPLSVSLCIGTFDYLLPVCLMDFKSQKEIDVIFFSSRNQSKQAQTALTPLVSIVSERDYGHRVLLTVHATLVLEINSTLGRIFCAKGELRPQQDWDTSSESAGGSTGFPN